MISTFFYLEKKHTKHSLSILFDAVDASNIAVILNNIAS